MKTSVTFLALLSWSAGVCQNIQRDELILEIINAEKLPKLGQIELTTYDCNCAFVFLDEEKLELGCKPFQGVCFLNHEEIFLFNIRKYYWIKSISVRKRRLIVNVALIDSKKEISSSFFKFRRKKSLWKLL